MYRFPLAALLLAPWAAQALEFNKVLPERSAVRFTYQQMGVKMEGRFRQFGSQLSFDPARPTAANARFDIDLASVDAGSADADQEVVGKPWFNAAASPKASFVSSGVKPLGGNRYEVSGQLTIKGNSRTIAFPASFTPQGSTGVFDGGFILRRADFNIGEGPWARFDVVGNEVAIDFRIVATGR